jgi:hypothetical protein
MELFQLKMTVFEAKILFSTQKRSFVCKHGTFSTENENFPSKNTFSISRRSFLTVQGSF